MTTRHTNHTGGEFYEYREMFLNEFDRLNSGLSHVESVVNAKFESLSTQIQEIKSSRQSDLESLNKRINQLEIEIITLKVKFFMVGSIAGFILSLIVASSGFWDQLIQYLQGK